MVLHKKGAFVDAKMFGLKDKVKVCLTWENLHHSVNEKGTQTKERLIESIKSFLEVKCSF